MSLSVEKLVCRFMPFKGALGVPTVRLFSNVYVCVNVCPTSGAHRPHIRNAQEVENFVNARQPCGSIVHIYHYKGIAIL